MNLDSRSQVFAMNATKISTAGGHQQHGLRLCISLVVLEMIDYAQLCGIKLLGPVALFAGSTRRDETVAFYGRFDRVLDAFKNGVYKLPCAPLFTRHPTRCAGSNVATHAINSRVR